MNRLSVLFRVLLGMIGCLLTGICLYGCDPAVEYYQVIENRSAHTLHILPADTNVFWRYLEDADSLIIEPESEDTLVKYWSIGQVDEFEACPFFSDSVRVRIAGDSLQLITALEASDNWVYQLISKGAFGSGACTCRLNITDEEIE